MIRVNLVTDIRPGLPQTGQERFRFLGLTPEGLVLLSHGGRLIQARVEGKAEKLPSPGDFLTVRVEQKKDRLELSTIKVERSTESGKPDVPREILGVFAELLHRGEMPPSELTRLQAYPMSDFLVVPGALQDKKRKGSILGGHGKLSGPYYFLLRTRFEHLGEIGLLFFSEHADFREPQVMLTAPNEYVRSRLTATLSSVKVSARVITSSEHVVDRSV